jgi:predicted ATPase/transcriptional regulator with XRE-family HTH domain
LTQEQLAARAGISTDAIAALERGKRRAPRVATVKLLADALGLTESERVAFLETLQAHTEAPGVEVSARTAPHLPISAMSLLTEEPTPLVGRSDELDTIHQRLVVDGVRLLTLTGPAGVGKTRLALATVAHLADHFTDGIVVVDLAPVRDPQQVLGAIARAFGFTDTGSLPLGERIETFLRERSSLLVMLDNFEQVLPAAVQLADLLATCPGLQLLATSRAPLRLRWEQTLRVAPLPVPDMSNALPRVEVLLTIPSVELFVGRARAHRAGFSLTEARAPLVAQLVTQLDGLPLALNLAAARLDALPLATIVRRVEDHLRLFHWDAADMPERQQSLEATLDWSYDLLSTIEQRLFRYLGVFVGYVTSEAIAVIAGVQPAVANTRTKPASDREMAQLRNDEAVDILLSLAEKSLILPRPFDAFGDGDKDEDPDLAFGMLETVREYAWERLDRHHELEAARRAHAYYFLALAEQADPELRRHGQRLWYLRLEREHDNLRAALRWLLDQDSPSDREAGLRLAGALAYFWDMRGFLAEGARWLETALERAPDADARVRTRALLGMGGRILIEQGKLDQSLAALEEAMAAAQQRQDQAAVAEALFELGYRALLAGDIMQSDRRLHESLDAFDRLNDRHGSGNALLILGLLHEIQGNRIEATDEYASALDHLETHGDARQAGTTRTAFASSRRALGDLPTAI